MKWGKALTTKVNEHPDWSPYFLNFKRLKKQLKVVREQKQEVDGEGALNGAAVQLDMHGLATRDGDTKERLLELSNEYTRPFLEELNSEVATVEYFYRTTLGSLNARLKEVVAARLESSDEDTGMLALHETQRDAKGLQEFCNLNYISAAKILKKLDKNMESSLKEIYINEVLNVQKFHTEAPAELRLLSDKLSRMSSTAAADGSSGNESVSISRGRHQEHGVRRDLNNDMAAHESTRHLALCIPLRREQDVVQVLVVSESSGPSRLVRSQIEAGESGPDAAVREMLEIAGLKVTVASTLGEYLSTTKKGTLYHAFVCNVEDVLEHWAQESVVHRRWLPLDEAISELEDNTSVRVLTVVQQDGTL